QSPDEMARGVADFARFDNVDAVVDAHRGNVQHVGEELHKAGYDNLAQWVVPDSGPPLLGIAVQYFFRRAVEEDEKLARGLEFAKMDRLQASQEFAFDGLNQALTEHADRMEELLGDIQTVVVETRDTVLDIKAEQERQGNQSAEIYQA